jgi:hypothetical protein
LARSIDSAAVAAIQAVHGRKSLGSVTVALGRAQFGAPFFSIDQKLLNFCNSNMLPSRNPKMSKLCMVLELSILNDISHWVNFQFPTEFKLQILEQTPVLTLPRILTEFKPF